MTRSYSRYAVFATFAPGAMHEALSGWLGWDAVRGGDVAQPELPALPRPVEALTRRPRKYGAHATMKAPFALAPGARVEELNAAFETFCVGQPTVILPVLHLSRIGRFLALTPATESTVLMDLAAQCVRAFEPFRAPLTEADRARRAVHLSPEQTARLERWGYPHVMEAFRFHITLTGPLRDGESGEVENALQARVMPHVPTPFPINALSLMGEDAETGRFHVLRSAALKNQGISTP